MKDNKKLYRNDPGCPIGGLFRLRLWRKKTKGGGRRILIKCGDCKESALEIYHLSPEEEYPALEINGVLASVTEWRRVLLPLLTPTRKVIEARERKL